MKILGNLIVVPSEREGNRIEYIYYHDLRAQDLHNFKSENTCAGKVLMKCPRKGDASFEVSNTLFACARKNEMNLEEIGVEWDTVIRQNGKFSSKLYDLEIVIFIVSFTFYFS